MTTSTADESRSEFAEWKEGQLFPVGWEEMDGPQKVKEIYMGRRGMLYWAQQSTWYFGIFMVVAWIVFRFVLPSAGVYDLAADLSSPSN